MNKIKDKDKDRVPVKFGYCRESTDSQINGLAVQREALKKAGVSEVFEDAGVSGSKNITEGNGWRELMTQLQRGDSVVVTSQSRLGRKSHQVVYAVGELIEAGVSVQVLDDNRTYDNLEDFSQNSLLAFRALTDHSERVEIGRRVQQTLTYLQSGGVRLGQKPKLTKDDVARIHELRGKQLGYAAISRFIEKPTKQFDGSFKSQAVSSQTIKRVLAGEYETVEAWEDCNRKARAKLSLGLNA
jgi:DNA invertase Pin-like site-specific DNA recombinase